MILIVSYNSLGDKMKVMKLDQEDVVIFLPNFSFDLLNRDVLEDYFRDLFLKLEDCYEIEMNGFYQIDLYTDSNYGTVVKIEGDDIPYFDYFDHQVEMSIHVNKENCFLYQVEDILDLPSEILEKSSFYQYQNSFFIQLNEAVSKPNYIRLLEYGSLVYGEMARKIMNFGKLFRKSLC